MTIAPRPDLCDQRSLMLTNGLEISTRSLSEHVVLFTQMASHGHGAWVVTLNLQMIALAARNAEYLSLIKGADAMVADGVPLVWLSQLGPSASRIKGRTNGTDLITRLLELPAHANVRIALIGGKDPGRLAIFFAENVVHYDASTIDEDPKRLRQLANDCTYARANVILLALGVPKQDRIAAYLRSRLPDVVIIGVGGALELLSGDLPRAPRWMQKIGAEWLHRLLTEPRRLWRRYLLEYPMSYPFLIKQTIILLLDRGNVTRIR